MRESESRKETREAQRTRRSSERRGEGRFCARVYLLFLFYAEEFINMKYF